VKILIPGDTTFNGEFIATSINEMTLSYQKEGSDTKSSCFVGHTALTNGKAILLDYYIDNWDINHKIMME
jgi:hypothetical protein